MLRLLALARIVIASISLLALADAQIQQPCFTTNLPSSPTNWASTATVPKFDTGLGTLVQIDFTLTGDLQGSAAAENLLTGPALVQLSFQAGVNLERPDHSLLVQTNPLAAFNDALAAYDGTVDFMGPSGVTHSGIVTAASSSAMSQSPSDLALFSGVPGNPGTIDLPITAMNQSLSFGADIVQFLQSAAATVQVCYTFQPNAPPTFTTGSPCGSSLQVIPGVPITFTMCAEDSDPSDVVVLSGLLPPGAITIPALPVVGNPACVTVNWTPTLSQIGLFQFHFTATDSHLRSADCVLSTLIVLIECYQVLGPGGGNSTFTQGGALFSTHLNSVRRAYPVTMVERPSLRVPDLATGQLQFSMQTLMHNPWDFPANPDQWSQRLRITFLPGQMVIGELFDSFNGIHQGLATFTDPIGDRYVTFPFTIDGM